MASRAEAWTREAFNDWLRRQGVERRGDVVISSPARGTKGRILEVQPSEATALVEISLDTPAALVLDRFRKNPVVLFAHDYDGLPVGKSLWEHLRPAQRNLGTLRAKVQFHRDTVLAREISDLVLAGPIYRVGFGYLPTRWSPDGDGYRLEAADLVEISFVLSPGLLDVYRKKSVCAPAFRKAIDALAAESDGHGCF